MTGRPGRGPFALPVAVFIVGWGGPVQLVTDPDDCSLCQQRDEVQIWNPDMTDGLTYELTPPAHRMWKVPCPVCRHTDFTRWEAPK
ncbi:hypothetical protein [Micromonospora aurantiaca (nom. illeg.)]|uniref:hypothetical protein n=1 Tax=Micromonospora aurantiaca (nom. illeg.) TaxID=47850 RepID=UPI0001BF4644|nr:hypothetical protein [Micromonospora aurantiaca]ADL43588.1 hypothetical protein Micau_0019 [Micromonospora aurantiaca ATCC 27029]